MSEWIDLLAKFVGLPAALWAAYQIASSFAGRSKLRVVAHRTTFKFSPNLRDAIKRVEADLRKEELKRYRTSLAEGDEPTTKPHDKVPIGRSDLADSFFRLSHSDPEFVEIVIENRSRREVKELELQLEGRGEFEILGREKSSGLYKNTVQIGSLRPRSKATVFIWLEDRLSFSEECYLSHPEGFVNVKFSKRATGLARTIAILSEVVSEMGRMLLVGCVLWVIIMSLLVFRDRPGSMGPPAGTHERIPTTQR